jgi:hypothetical protein
MPSSRPKLMSHVSLARPKKDNGGCRADIHRDICLKYSIDASIIPFHQLRGTWFSSAAFSFFDGVAEVADLVLDRESVVVAVVTRSMLSA